ncbi:chromatin assembly factor 1 subunit A-domain-containing protein [Boeremia exigua]|uniref:chromatin assembly factor 1 subunit A-domain-containing protein n=1 Tax=Boeremia exigua TaxID=749465 RepID=UPI001E8D49E6|nr:chromatin assembly factor 1 subunit A-domain-containing protein [Boeremia exigua]KAH6638758.1 chromatin assembly factor 1 subunit A-domain-containing protein [Boeremia exigua]
MENSAPAAPNPQKRSHDDHVDVQPSTPVKAISSQASTPLSVLSNVETPSPMQSTAPVSSSATNQPLSQPALGSSSTQQPAKKKRRVLTQQEKDDAAREKEVKSKAKADKAAQKEAEAKLKADEKAQKAAQKEAENKTKAGEKAKKEAEKREKEEEKAKKERSQMRLNAFFMKPKATGSSAGPSVVDSIPDSTAPSITLPLHNSSGAVANVIPPSPQKSIQKNAHSDYERCFLPFALSSHAILAPTNAFMENPEKLRNARERLDQLSRDSKARLEPFTIKTFKTSLSNHGGRGLKVASIAEVVKQVHGAPDRPIDLSKDAEADQQQPLRMLKTIPMKYIHFGEDVRPPYYGTYTKPVSDVTARRLARNAVSRARHDTNYDYDSEAEWEEPEEGEDLDSEGEDDLEEDGDDDMDGFLDDEEDPQLKRRMLSGDLVPVSTGLCWENAKGVSVLNDGSGAICTDFKDFKMGFLLDPYPRSIDPFSTSYWTPPEHIVAVANATTHKKASTNSLVNPPRVPLTQRTMNGLLNTLNSSSSPLTASKPAVPKKMVPDDQLPAFKAEIHGKDLTKIGMIEALKKAFPKLPKAAITNTLSTVAARVGPTEKEKRWVLINN